MSGKIYTIEPDANAPLAKARSGELISQGLVPLKGEGAGILIVEITPEMVAAGIEELKAHLGSLRNADDAACEKAVRRVYALMRAANASHE